LGLIPTEKWIGAVAGVEFSHPGMRAMAGRADRTPDRGLRKW
jgi:hypothetical protein